MYFYKGEIYHVFNKSIGGFKILSDWNNCRRFLFTLSYYSRQYRWKSLSKHLKDRLDEQIASVDLLTDSDGFRVKFIAYCLMPDHYHLLIKIKNEDNFSKLIADIENSFTRYFNIKFKRKGPLWQSAFKAVRVCTNWQLLHVSRYIHLNPTTSHFVKRPQDWKHSSYEQYIGADKNIPKEISINKATDYQKFCEDQISYQKVLKQIKRSILE
ncbi:transposase [Patescibacteria group bacterium]|nr:transposase [Patescibacteria group bacterium]MCL5092008.1 transposase [Patescibacteria group bacterium]